MTDVFISYKREDRQKARAIAESLARRGLDVWWDVELLAGQKFAEEINAVIQNARAAIVLWTPESIDSHWVLAEANLALERKILVPVWLETIALPAPFNTLHTLDLTEWNGLSKSPALEGLVNAVSRLTGLPVIDGSQRSTPEIEETLLKPAHELEFWASVSSKAPPSISEYRLYLTKYGEGAAFSDLARHRIAEISANLEKRKWPSLASSLTLTGVVIATVLGILQIKELVVPKPDPTESRKVVECNEGILGLPGSVKSFNDIGLWSGFTSAAVRGSQLRIGLDIRDSVNLEILSCVQVYICKPESPNSCAYKDKKVLPIRGRKNTFVITINDLYEAGDYRAILKIVRVKDKMDLINPLESISDYQLFSESRDFTVK